MSRTKRFVVTTLACFALALAALALLPGIASAGSGSQDGLSVVLTTDKSSYTAGDTVTATVTVTNTSSSTNVNNVQAEIVPPSGVSLKSGTGTVLVGTINAGGNALHRFELIIDAGVTTPKPGAPKTGDDTNLLLWVGIAFVVAVGIAAVACYGKRKAARMLSVLLCFVLFAALVPALPAEAFTVSRNFTVGETIVVDGNQKNIYVKITYDWEEAHITYNVNGGNVSSAPVDNTDYYTYSGAPTVTTDIPTHSDSTKVFVGWNTKADGSGNMLFGGDNIIVMGDITLFAVWGGDGSSVSNPILIYTQAALADIGIDAASLGKHYALIADIALVGSWTPLGNDIGVVFTGTLDGNGHTISNLTMNFSDTILAGLFSIIDAAGASVQNLCVEIGSGGVTSLGVAGGIAADLMAGTIQNCAVKGGSISDDLVAGGIVGGMGGTGTGSIVQNCYSTSDVSSSDNAGGIVGIALVTGTVVNCYATGAINSSGGLGMAGGIAAQVPSGLVYYCVALNSRGVTGTSYTGRVTGLAIGTATNCLAESSFTVTGDGTYAYNGTTQTLAELQVQSAYTGLGWSFGTTDASPWVWSTSLSRPILYFEV